MKKIFILILLNFLIIQNSYSQEKQEIYELEAEKVEYKNKANLVIATGNAFAKNNFNKKIYADKIIYNKEKNIIFTVGNSKYDDGIIKLFADNFKFNINLKIIEAKKNVKLLDDKNNKYNFSFIKYYQTKQLIIGEDIKVNLSDGSYLDASTGELSNKTKITKLKNSRYTTCSKIMNDNKFCPSWSLNSKNVIHDKDKRKIIHKNALLKIRNIPILYSPYFSHPDPTVKRQSGFMPPLIKTISNIGRTVKIPYYWVISDDKDLTFSPVYYADEKNALLSSYRQDLKNGFLNIESGYSGGYKRTNKTGRTKGSRNYLFAKYEGISKGTIFKNNEVKFKIERISQKNFVRVNKINTALFKEDIKTLENSFKITSFDNNKRLEIRTGIFENLTIQNNDKYTYFFPDGIFSYSSTKFENFKLNFNSYFQGKKFSDNQKQFKLRNLVNLENKQLVNKSAGIGTVFKANIYNKNIFNRNVIREKENENIDNFYTLAMNNNLPLVKFGKNIYHTLTPRIFTKYTSGKQLDASTNLKILNYSDIFSMNRTNDLDTPETGLSAGYGIDYTLNKNIKDNSSGLKFSTSFGQILNSSKESKLPNTTSLNNKSTDYLGYFKLNIFEKSKDKNETKMNTILQESFRSNNFSVSYNYNLANNFEKINRNSFSIDSTYNNFKSSISFDEKNNHIGNERSVRFDLKKLFNNFYYFRYDGKKNLLNDQSEYHNFSINYENDCIVTSLALSKNFYYDQDFSASKSLLLNITLKPFSDNISPDLTSFIN